MVIIIVSVGIFQNYLGCMKQKFALKFRLHFFGVLPQIALDPQHACATTDVKEGRGSEFITKQTA